MDDGLDDDSIARDTFESRMDNMKKELTSFVYTFEEMISERLSANVIYKFQAAWRRLEFSRG